MKKIFLVVTVLSVFLFSNFSFALNKNGFEDCEWGKNIKDFKGKYNLKKIGSYSDPLVGEVHEYSTNIKTFEGVNISECKFEFVGDRFYEVRIIAKGFNNYSLLKKVIEKNCGKGEKYNDEEKYNWNKELTWYHLGNSKALDIIHLSFHVALL